MKTLVIVESPAKSKTIQKYLGSKYIVVSSKGHLRDLSKSGPGRLGLDFENKFTPKYSNIKEKKSIIDDLKKKAKGNKVLLAADLDREGEAISWHIAQLLKLEENDENRVVFTEITKDSILEAIKKPRKIDYDLVNSQETRRVLDRIIGFKLSRLMQAKVKSRSAGRVQSVALKMIVELEEEIQKFIPEEYWKLTGLYNEFELEFDKFKGEKKEFSNEQEIDEVMSNIEDQFIVESVTVKDKKKRPSKPYITSTLQQEASSKLGIAPSRTMQIAQKLYEGVTVNGEHLGLITYMRTDSYRLSNVFLEECNEFVSKKYGDEYVGKYFAPKNKKGAQDAHEAIRPTRIDITPEVAKQSLTPQELKLYDMIYSRALAATMTDAVMETTKAILNCNDVTFKLNAQTVKFEGYLKVFGKFTQTKIINLPEEFKVDAIIKGIVIEKKQHFTKPKARFNQASIIKEMEDNGIGRPSTYAATVNTLKLRGYVVVEDKKLIPTKQGILTVKKLGEYFEDIVNVEYTAKLEERLDKIAHGDDNYYSTISEFYNDFIQVFDEAMEKMDVVPDEETGEICPNCGSNMIFKLGRFGKFEACSNFPDCKYIKKKNNDISTGIECTECGKGEVVIKTAVKGRSKGSHFYACNKYPTCKTIYKEEKTNLICKACGKEIVNVAGVNICSDVECNEIQSSQ